MSDDIKLPELPEPSRMGTDCDSTMRYFPRYGHTDEAMQAYARAAVELNRAWLPIESAPMDGTTVLVYPPTWNSKSTSTARFDEDKYAKRPRPYWRRDDDLGRVTISRDLPPTHWMPLPPPPEID